MIAENAYFILYVADQQAAATFYKTVLAAERAAGGGVTMRNWRTVLRVQALVRKGE